MLTDRVGWGKTFSFQRAWEGLRKLYVSSCAHTFTPLRSDNFGNDDDYGNYEETPRFRSSLREATGEWE